MGTRKDKLSTGKPEEEGSNRSAPTDLELMSRVWDGDQTAFEALVQRHEDGVFSLAARVLGRVEDARDVAQEVFIALWENPRAWKPSALFSTWLYRVTMNRALNRRRLDRVKSFLSLSDPNADASLALQAYDDPEQELIRNEKRRRLALEIQRLPPRQRAALHLKYTEGLPVAEVAQVLKVSLKSAESLLFRARQTLKERLDGT